MTARDIERLCWIWLIWGAINGMAYAIWQRPAHLALAGAFLLGAGFAESFVEGAEDEELPKARVVRK